MNIFNDFELLDFINLDEMMFGAGTSGASGVTVPAAHLLLSAYAPSHSVSAVYIPTGHVVLAAYPPTMEETAHVPAAGLVITAHAPECGTFISTEITDTGHIVLTAYAPTHTGGTVAIPTAHVVLTGHAPGCGVAQIEAETGHLTITAYAPAYSLAANIPAASLLLTGHAPSFGPVSVDIPHGGLILTPHAPTYYRISTISTTASLILTAHAPDYGVAAVIIPKATALELSAYSPTQSWSLGVNARYKMQSIYQCILTGDADGLTDLVIPISFFQSTVRDGDPSYLACVIPNSLAYITDIMARTNGDIVIKQGYKLYDGSIQAEEIIRVDYENLQDARGGRSASTTISGHRTTSSSIPKSVELEEVTYYGLQTNGKRTFRAKPDIFLRVGDTAVYGTESIVIGQISYVVDTLQAIMQVTEA